MRVQTEKRRELSLGKSSETSTPKFKKRSQGSLCLESVRIVEKTSFDSKQYDSRISSKTPPP